MATFDDVREEYSRYLSAEKALSLHTVRAYLGDVDSFTEHLGRNGVETLDQAAIHLFLVHLLSVISSIIPELRQFLYICIV